MAAAVLVLLAVSTVTTGEIIRRSFPHPDEIDGSPCPWKKPIAASKLGASDEFKCLGVSEILKYGELKDINER